MSRLEHARRRFLGVSALSLAHPVVSVFLAALLVRSIAAVASSLLVDGYLVPDERQYVELAATVAAGRPAESWLPGYGDALYDSTVAFTGALAGVFSVTGPHRLAGQMLVALLGAATAALSTRLALEVVSRGWALGCGAVVALVPSQVLWSSVVLREASVWSASAVVALALAVSARSTRTGVLVGAAAAAGSGLLVLGHLRDQTLAVLAFAMVAATFAYRAARAPWAHRVVAMALMLVVPHASGIGWGGYDLVERALPNLATARANLAQGAESAIDRPRPLASRTPSGTPGSGSGVEGAPEPPGTAAEGPGYVARPPVGVEVEDGAAADLAYLPRGLVAVTLRPYPWEAVSGVGPALAKLENLGWGVLYVLAVVGAWAGRRRLRVVAFPLLATAAVLLSSALTQGNLGTAFRHRGQVLWAVALLAAVGAEHLARRRALRGSEVGDVRASGAHGVPRVEDQASPVG